MILIFILELMKDPASDTIPWTYGLQQWMKITDHIAILMELLVATTRLDAIQKETTSSQEKEKNNRMIKNATPV